MSHAPLLDVGVKSSEWFPLTPVQRWFFDLNLEDRNHFNQCILLRSKTNCSKALDIPRFDAAVRLLVAQHQALRHRFGRVAVNGSVTWAQRIISADEDIKKTCKLHDFP